MRPFRTGFSQQKVIALMALAINEAPSISQRSRGFLKLTHSIETLNHIVRRNYQPFASRRPAPRQPW